MNRWRALITPAMCTIFEGVVALSGFERGLDRNTIEGDKYKKKIN